MRKVFGMIALLLALAACNKAETDIPTEKPKARAATDGITITATLAPKSFGTKAVSEGTNTIVSTWAQDEKIAVLYEVNEKEYAAEAKVVAVDDETGAATISFSVASGTADNTHCTLVYPASAAKDDHTGVKDAAVLLAAQDGTLNASLDVRVGAGTIKTATPGLDVTTQPAPQFAIFKFTTKNKNGTVSINVKPLTITIDEQSFVITPASATSTLYAALPAISSEAVGFSATGSDTKTYEAAYPGISFAAGNFYKSELKLAWYATGHSLATSFVGEVVGTDGKAYAVADKDHLPTGVTAAGMVAYKSGKTGLVIAFTDDNKMSWAEVNGTSGVSAHTPVIENFSWRLPTENEWKQTFEANGGIQTNCTGLNTALVNAGGTALLTTDDYYWSSSPGDYGIRIVRVNSGGSTSWASQDVSGSYTTQQVVRAYFAFDSNVFSVSPSTRVTFASGNLTYTSNGWALAQNSWEYSDTAYGPIAGSHHFSWYDVFKDADSGNSNIWDAIKTKLGSNSWRALSRDEWRYLLGYQGSTFRTVSWHRYAKIYGAEVGSGNKRYLLIFPDLFRETDWTAAMGQKPSATAFDGAGQESIAYTESNFAAMQTAGIVILPAAGLHYNGDSPTWHDEGLAGYYWTSTPQTKDDAYYVYFLQYDSVVSVSDSYFDKGARCYSVRLVQNK